MVECTACSPSRCSSEGAGSCWIPIRPSIGDAAGGGDGGVVGDGGVGDAGDAAYDAGDAACIPMAEICDGLDNDCDGLIDDDCGCDRYVLANATGDGRSASTPMGSINVAISDIEREGGGSVCVGAEVEGGVCVATRYGERVNMSDGINVTGGFRAEGASWAQDPACVTKIAPVGGSGVVNEAVLFRTGDCRGTTLSNFTIVGPDAVGATSVGVLFEGGGTVRGSIVRPGQADRAYGVSAPPGDGVVVIDGGQVEGASPPGGTALGTVSIAVYLREREAQLLGVERISGGHASGNAVGIAAEMTHDLRVDGVAVIEGGEGDRSLGISLTNDQSAIIQNVGTITAMAGTSESTGVSAFNVDGLDIHDVGTVLGGTSGSVSAGFVLVSTRNANLTNVGTIGGGEGPLVYGLAARDGTRLMASSLRSLYASATAATPGARYVGMVCEGSGTTCEIASSLLQGVTADTSSFVSAVEYHSGVAGSLMDNEIRSGAVAGAGRGVLIEGADPMVIDANRVYELASHTAAQEHYAIAVTDTEVQMTNNFITVSGQSVGLAFAFSGEAATFPAQVDSNTFNAVPTPMMSSGSGPVLVRLGSASSTTLSETEARFRNDIFLCRPGVGGAYFQEAGFRARVLSNSVLYGCARWISPDMLASDAVTLLTTTFGPGNLLASDPQISPDGHISEDGSPANGNADPMVIPMRDFDGETRDTSMPDIGCDERL